jgi:hypothetical protein
MHAFLAMGSALFCAATVYADSIIVNELGPYHQGQSITFGADYGNYARHQITKKQWANSPYWIYTYVQNPFVWCTCYDSNPNSAYYNATVVDNRLSFHNSQETKVSRSLFTSDTAPFLLSGTNDEYGPDPWPAEDSANCSAKLVYAAKTPDGIEIFTITEVGFSVVP